MNSRGFAQSACCVVDNLVVLTIINLMNSAATPTLSGLGTTIERAAANLVFSLPWARLVEVATLGYKGPLPAGVPTDADSEFAFRNAVQDLAKTLEAVGVEP